MAHHYESSKFSWQLYNKALLATPKIGMEEEEFDPKRQKLFKRELNNLDNNNMPLQFPEELQQRPVMEYDQEVP